MEFMDRIAERNCTSLETRNLSCIYFSKEAYEHEFYSARDDIEQLWRWFPTTKKIDNQYSTHLLYEERAERTLKRLAEVDKTRFMEDKVSRYFRLNNARLMDDLKIIKSMM